MLLYGWLIADLTSGDRDARNNQLNGTLDIGTGSVNKLAMIDLRTNKISRFTARAGIEKVEIM